jgi:glycosyltransferase involved in cell wall biosynthesis
MEKNNILHITKIKQWNGEVQQLYILVVELKKMGLDICVLCPAQSAIHQKLIEANIDTYTFSPEQNKSYILTSIINKIKAELKIDLVHLHSSSLILTAIIFYSFFDKKMPFLLAKKSMIRGSSILSQLKYNHPVIRKTLCVSQAVKSTLTDLIWKKNRSKIEVVYDGINTDLCKNISSLNIRQKYNIKDTDFIIGNIANHTTAKDLEIFVETANYVVNTMGSKDIKFIQIGGETKHSNTLYNLAEKYNLAENLFFVGFHNNASSLLPQFDVMLMTSKREGLPLTIYEAFAYKTPVVSTKAGGIPEAIKHERTGLLSEISDYQSLANNLIKIKENTTLRIEIVGNAKKLLNNKFTQSVMAKNTFDVYLEIISE